MYYFYIEWGWFGLIQNRYDLCCYIWLFWLLSWWFDDVIWVVIVFLFENLDFVEIVLYFYWYCFGGILGDLSYDEIEECLLVQFDIFVFCIVF